jgi:aspartyl-tRNA(Asn)/glutamyl-tRNA(Gln) amidotransferase subunit B
MFCSCAADYQTADPNTRVCPVCMGMPGVLPVINRRAIEFTIMAGLALNCDIAQTTKFDRKNYGYPDLMKGYQISQFDLPIAEAGHLDLTPSEAVPGGHRVGITRVHLEEEVARLTHVGAYSLMDVNRAGVPLMEVVTEPDIRTSAQAEAYILDLQQTMRYLGISTANMEEGSFRCDANISIRPMGQEELGVKVEIKNMNRVRAVVRAIEFEIKRQTKAMETGERIVQETRGWDDEKGVTNSQRSKEEANDYRYFPEPDLPPLFIERSWVEDLGKNLPELAGSRHIRFVNDYGLSDYDASLLTSVRDTAEYYEAVVASRDLSGESQSLYAKESANWINGEVARLVNAESGPDALVSETAVKPAQLASLVEMFQTRAISNNAAKQVFEEMFRTGRSPEEIVDEKGLKKVDDSDALTPIISDAIEANPQAVDDYLNGKDTAIRFLVGQVMKATRGAADASVVLEILTEKLKDPREVG